MRDSLEFQKRIADHPCYSEGAAFQYARLHLAVAPKCNIQCNYCHRSYDCANECRPGITRELLTPQDALLRVRAVKLKIPQLSVAGIAGPGDPLANPSKTFETFRLIGEAFPDLRLCLSTNGLALPEHLDALKSHQVNFVTVTVNAVDPEIGAQIYAWVRKDKEVYRGREAAQILWRQQKKGLEGLIARGMIVKVNTVLIPGINEDHIVDIARVMSELGVYLFNIMPLIPVPATPFENFSPPSLELRREVVQECMPLIRIMRHCRHCRSDAVGLLGQDRSGEFSRRQVETLLSGRNNRDDY